jgi:hypothetical protein
MTIDGNWVFQTSIRTQDAWKAGGVFLALALVSNIAVEVEEMPTILGGAVNKEGGVPWKKWNAV